jgi:hypothetical protein
LKFYEGTNRKCRYFESAVQQQCPVTESRHFPEFANAVENLTVTVENLDGMSHLTNNLIIEELLKKLPEYLRLQ